MRRFAVPLLALVVFPGFMMVEPNPPGLIAQTPDQAIATAIKHRDAGEVDEALTILRAALASRPADTALKQALRDTLNVKRGVLAAQLNEVERELVRLRLGATEVSVTPARVPAVMPANCSETAARVGGNIGPPRKVHHVPAVYPADARENRVTGVVIVEAVIDCAGNVSDAKVLRGEPLLNDAAVEAVRQWRYLPTLLNGVPVPVVMTVTVTFNLQN